MAVWGTRDPESSTTSTSSGAGFLAEGLEKRRGEGRAGGGGGVDREGSTGEDRGDLGEGVDRGGSKGRLGGGGRAFDGGASSFALPSPRLDKLLIKTPAPTPRAVKAKPGRNSATSKSGLDSSTKTGDGS